MVEAVKSRRAVKGGCRVHRLHRSGTRRAVGYACGMALVGVGVATALVYALWVAWVPLLPDNVYVPLLDLGKITGYTWPSALLYLALLTALYGLYALGYRAAGRSTQKLILAFGGLFCLELLFAYPATAVDVFGYIAHGRLLAVHHLNPFIFAPDEFPNDLIIAYLAYPGEPSQYGPVWVLLGGGLALLAHGNLLLEVLLYKMVGGLAHLASAGLIYAIVACLSGNRPGARASSYLFLWNPMLLWEMVGNAHNDGLMMLGGLAGIYLLARTDGLLTLPAIALGGLVKLPVLAIAPLLFVALWRRRPLVALEGALLALALAVAVYRPFWEGPATLTALRRTDLFTASLGSVLRLGLAPQLGLDLATNVARGLSLGAFAGIALLAFGLAWRTSRLPRLLGLAYLTLLAGVLLGTTWFQAWYVVWPAALGAALGNARRHLEVALLSLGGLLQYLVFIYLWVMGLFPMVENVGVQAAAYTAVVGPLVVGSIAYATLESRRVRCTRR
jgi:alpha-1,6-mannosyltransferase